MKKRLLIILGVLVAIVLGISFYYQYSLKSVSQNTDLVTFEIKKGTSRKDVVKNLKNANIIKNDLTGTVYVYIHDLHPKAGIYQINRADSTKTIMEGLANGKSYSNEIKVTFIEGKRVTDYAKTISDNFGYDYNDVLNVFKDREYAKELVAKYSFLSDSILNENIYYPLEGYLFPDTYTFYRTSTVKEIIEKILNQENIKLNLIKSNIDASGMSIHQIVTLASIVEMEGTNASNRANISQVIYTRLKLNMPLQMDVTTYYAVQKSMSEVLTTTDLNSSSLYNTRNTKNLGLPIGPICSPSYESLMAGLNPSDTDYVYFYASKDGNIYFTSDVNEFNVFKNRG
jgi:UPF0755 protein